MEGCSSLWLFAGPIVCSACRYLICEWVVELVFLFLNVNHFIWTFVQHNKALYELLYNITRRYSVLLSDRLLHFKLFNMSLSHDVFLCLLVTYLADHWTSADCILYKWHSSWLTLHHTHLYWRHHRISCNEIHQWLYNHSTWSW